MAKLIFVLEDGQEVVIPLAGRIAVGRGDDNDVVVDDERISPHHAEVLFDADGRVEVRSLESGSEIFVNDQSIQSQIIRQGDTLAFGPLTARLDLENPAAPALEETIRRAEERLAQVQSAVDQGVAAHGKWITSIQELSVQHDEKTSTLQKLAAAKSATQEEIESLTARHDQDRSRLAQLRDECGLEEQRLSDFRRQLAEVEERCRAGQTRAGTLQEQTQAAGKNLEQLGVDERQAQESLVRLQTELAARTDDLAAETLRVDEAKARLAEMEAKCQAFAHTEKQLDEMRAALAATERQEAELKVALQKTQAQLDSHIGSLEKASSAEAAAQARIEDLTSREKALRVKLENSSPAIEQARNELADIESRLTPLRDWKKSMDQRYARLNTLAKGSPEEKNLWHEIEGAQAALFDLLPAARIEAPGLTRGDFSRISKHAGVPMKSDRIRRAAP